jgi:hypothetical protein
VPRRRLPVIFAATAASASRSLAIGAGGYFRGPLITVIAWIPRNGASCEVSKTSWENVHSSGG